MILRKNPQNTTMKYTQTNHGSLQCIEAQTGEQPTIAVILCHGYGADGEDLASLAQPLAQWLEGSADQFKFVFPNAPFSPPEFAAFGGRAWWPLNMERLLALSQANKFSELHDVEPPGIDLATRQLAECVQSVLDSLPEYSSYALGGFSQGAMVSLNAALRTDIPVPECLIQFSGTLICQPQWQAELSVGRLATTRVLQSHGRWDTILPFSSAMSLHELLEGHCQSNQFMAFDGPHTIPMEALMQLAVKLKLLATP